jgi:hypothetical protein
LTLSFFKNLRLSSKKTATPIRRIGCGRPCEAGPLRFIKNNRNADPKDRLRQALRSRAAKLFLN